MKNNYVLKTGYTNPRLMLEKYSHKPTVGPFFSKKSMIDCWKNILKNPLQMCNKYS